MNRLLSILMICLLNVSLMAASTFNLNVGVSPHGAGSVNTAGGQYEEGAKISLRTNNNTGYVFLGWFEGDNLISSSTNFSYTMPGHDITLTAQYEFDPEVPGNPNPMDTLYSISVVAKPTGAGSFNRNNASTKAGQAVNLRAYPSTGYKFLRWEDEDNQTLSEGIEFNYVMPNKSSQIYGIFEFDPETPSNPNKNYWNSETGELIIDDFMSGSLYDETSRKIGSGNFSKVYSFIVKGTINENDFGVLESLTNIATADYSRVGGVSKVPSYGLDNLSASSILLPSCISSMGDYVFRNDNNLTAITIYSQEPPACTDRTFANFNNKENCTIFVPASAIELYSNADYWKDFSILPITADAHSLLVNIPEGYEGAYKNCILEIRNLRNGVRQRYVVSDRLQYSFNGLQKDETYDVLLLSQSGLEIGRLENVTIPDDDFEVTFDSLRQLHTIFAKVMTHDGADVTQDVSVEWLQPLADGALEYLRKANSIGEIPEGHTLVCRVTLDSKLGSAYVMPTDTKFTADKDQSICLITLAPFRSIEISGTVVDGNKAALSGASVSVNQTLNRKYPKSYTAKTDRDGKWVLTVLDAPETRLTFAASECVNVNDTIYSFEPGISTLDLGTTTLKSIVGARVNYGFTYHSAGSDDVQDFYSDYQNVAVSVFNVTQNRPHNDVSLQYPILAVLDENINAGDELRLTATSKTGAFNPIEENVTIDENQRADVTFDIVGKGGLAASFEMTDNPAVVAMLYSENGELLKKQTYSEAKTTFTDLEDGEYTLVSMGQSDLMNSILRLSSFDEIGLAEGKDYVVNNVEIESGRLTEVSNQEIPAFDESLFYYTNSSTSFTSNKSSITTGNYLTLRSAIDFKGAYKDGVSNVALVVDLPEACDFVEQSVIQGPNLLPYTIDNNRLTIQLGNSYTSQVRFCVVPTAGGSFNATGSIVFDYDGKAITQPIGSATSEIKDLEISVPNIISDKTFKVSGFAIPNSDIQIYEGNIILGNGKSNLKGTWTIDCILSDPYNLSKHSVYAKIKSPSGNILISETRSTTFDENALQVSKVTMINTAHTASSLDLFDYETVFDFINPQVQSPYWYWPSYPTFTFMIDFTSNNPKRILNVILYVHTSSGEIVPLTPSFDDKLGCWIAQNDFDSYSLPINVSIDYDAVINSSLSRKQLSTPAFDYLGHKADIDDIDDKFNQFEIIVDTLSNDEYERIFDELTNSNFIKSEGIYQTIDEAINAVPNLLDISSKLRTELAQTIESLSYISQYNSFDLSEYGIDGDFIIENTANVNVEELVLKGYSKITIDDNSEVYELAEEGRIEIIDMVQSIHYTLNYSNETSSLYAKARNGFNIEDLKKKIDTFNDIFGGFLDLSSKINECLSLVKPFFDLKINTIDLTIEENRNAYQALQYFEGMSLDPKVNEDISNKIKKLKNENRALGKDKAKLLRNKEATMKAIEKVTAILAAFFDAYSAGSNASEYIDLWYSVPYCSCYPERTENLQNEILNAGLRCAGKDIANIIGDLVAIHLIFDGAAAAVTTAGTSLVLSIAGISLSVIKGVINIWSDNEFKKERARFQSNINALAKDSSCNKCDNPTPGPDKPSNPSKGFPKSNELGGACKSCCPDVEHVQDPSGYVFEAVPENRVEGVQATIYYKETKEDMYGDPYEEVILWDAEEYAQENPLFTDEYGMYQWDVPQGLWQVKFEKDGYVTAYSEWLPVPPPQLEVNIGIVQNKQPEVTEARAYEEGIEVQFDKYMNLSTLTPDNIYVTANGKKLNGTINLLDSALSDEYADENDTDAIRFASRLRFVPEAPLSVADGEIRLTVSKNVLSYAGIPMAETFSQVFDIEKEVTDIIADNVKVLYGGEKQVTVYALPAEASAKKTLRVSSSSDLIMGIDKADFELDEEGKAIVTVKGNLPGKAQLSFSIEGVTATGSTAVDVVTEIITADAPSASRASGTTVYGGSTVALSTDTKNGVIYFTTDGSCPCDENGTRRKYTVPIVIDRDMQILAMTSVGDGKDDESEIAEFNYYVKKADMEYSLKEGWNWISNTFYNPIPSDSLLAHAEVTNIVGQNGEIHQGSDDTPAGELLQLESGKSYKVSATAPVAIKGNGIAWNPSSYIPVNPGCNWIGYPSAMALEISDVFDRECLAPLDVIVGQRGFAQYDGESWIGSLQTLAPGEGYMFYADSQRKLTLNGNNPEQTASRPTSSTDGCVDIYKYPSIMPLVATLVDSEGNPLDNNAFKVYAYSNGECRGQGEVFGNLIMMNIYGSESDPITFEAVSVSDEMSFCNLSPIPLCESVMGNINEPYRLSLTEGSGVKSIMNDGNITIVIDNNTLFINGIDTSRISSVEIFDVSGIKLIAEYSVNESGIDITRLPHGAYIVVVNASGGHSYHKINRK